VDLLFEIHRGLPREAPGSDEATCRALRLARLPPQARVLDIGCGPGMQTLTIALHTRRVVALDTHRPYLEVLAASAVSRGLEDRIDAVQASMLALPFADGTFDAVWSEGAAYIAGFDRAVRDWRRLLNAGGRLVASELCWLQPHPPDEPSAFWARAYPAMRSIDGNLRALERAGYRQLDRFVLPTEAWWTSYYGPLGLRLATLRETYAGDDDARRQLDDTAREIELFRNYSDWYGYVFFIAAST
jgi:SAM-dependent methyltransferase